MQGMTPLEVKYHLRDIERSFCASRLPTQAAADRHSSGKGGFVALLTWITRPFCAVEKRVVD